MHKLKNIGAVALATALPFIGITAASAAPCAVPGDYPTIQSAVNEPTCSEINVAPGTYPENVNVTRTCTINGAQKDGNTDFATRSANIGGESVVNGAGPGVSTPIFTINASGITIDGFTISNAVNLFSSSGIEVKGNGNGATIVNNIFDGISTADTSGNGTAQAVYLSAGGPDNVSISNNEMKNIHANRSTKGVLIGDNGPSNNPSQAVTIAYNSIHDIVSDTRGAYGVSVANVTNVSGLKIQHNEMSNLTGGGWVHAIGLEGDTPGVDVSDNNISNIVDTGANMSSPGFIADDSMAVWFESNPSFSTAEVHNNNFDIATTSYGIAVHPDISGTGSVNGTCNWWNSPTGPTTASNPGGTGAQVGPRVTYKPWLIAPGPDGQCFGGNVPATAAQCKGGGWMNSARANGTAFKNQGDCIQYINTGK
jgi:hypothetical protein